MAVLLTTRWPGPSSEGYERLRQELMKGGLLPDAARLQVAAMDGPDLVLTEIWDSRAAAEAFRADRLGPAARRVGLEPPPAPEVLEVHRVLGPGGRSTAGTRRRVLVVANRTLGSTELEEEMRRRVAYGPSVFHLLVPASPLGVVAVAGAGVGGQELEDPFLQDQLMQTSWENARQILDEHVDGLRRKGFDVTGEIGLADPATAVRLVVGRRRFDEVILSTLPAGLSRWLGMDLPSRLRRVLEVPLTVVTADNPED